MAQGKIYESDTVWVNYCGHVELRRSGSNHDWQLGDVSRGGSYLKNCSRITDHIACCCFFEEKNSLFISTSYFHLILLHVLVFFLFAQHNKNLLFFCYSLLINCGYQFCC